MYRRYFIAGLLVWVPIWVTLLILKFIVDLVDQTFLLLPARYHPDYLLGVHIPGLGIIFAVVLIFVTGMLVTNFIGHWLVQLWEAVLSRIPLVRSIYNGVKQIMTTMFTSTGESFRKVFLVEYPRKGMWSIAFQTGSGFSIPNRMDEEGMEGLVTIYVPTTPNPTSGFMLIVPRREVVELDMTIDQALKLVISLGVVLPPSMADQMLNRKSKESI